MIVFNIQKFGDFDMPYTVLTMQTPVGMTPKLAKELINEAEEMFKTSDDEDGVITYLKTWGCTVTKSYDITIGGAL